MAVIVVTGIPGVGSSTVLKEAFKLDEELSKEFIVVNYGDVMFEVAHGKKLIKHRDQLRKLPDETQREIQRLACEKIVKLGKNIIVDTHCTVKTPAGYLPGLPEWVLKALKPKQLVIVEANPDEIWRRRTADKTRQRDVEGDKGIEEHQSMNRAAAMAYAALTGACVKIIENHDGAVEAAAKEFLELLRLVKD
ncbi:adenylate kinase [Candidatus Alkanophaga liquidiphilum]|nr:MAG: adenylate kinase [Candidatus Alkanophagales archaeon]